VGSVARAWVWCGIRKDVAFFELPVVVERDGLPQTGWRVSFVIAGGIGFAWLAAWLMFFDAPEKVRWLSREEREKIVRERDAKLVGTDSCAAETTGPLALMRSPTLWGLAQPQVRAGRRRASRRTRPLREHHRCG